MTDEIHLNGLKAPESRAAGCCGQPVCGARPAAARRGHGRWAVKDPNAIGTNSTLMVISPTTFEPITASAVFGPASGASVRSGTRRCASHCEDGPDGG
jgi:hypothetical protein